MDPSQHQHQNHSQNQNPSQQQQQQHRQLPQQFNGSLAYPAPPHIFNNYSSAGNSPNAASVQGASYAGDSHGYDDDVDDRGTDHGQGDPKRRRIARACDMCRKKKIKCDGVSPKCSHCANYKTECIFTQVEKKRNAPKG